MEIGFSLRSSSIKLIKCPIDSGKDSKLQFFKHIFFMFVCRFAFIRIVIIASNNFGVINGLFEKSIFSADIHLARRRFKGTKGFLFWINFLPDQNKLLKKNQIK